MNRLVVVQVALFALVAVIVIPFGVYYIVGPSALGDEIRVRATVDNALGVDPDTVVTYRGVEVGSVASVGVDPHRRGAVLDLALRSDADIPTDSFAKITQGTLAGMLNVDIFPRVDHGPYLVDGDEISMPAAEQPVQISETMAHAADLLGSIEPGSLSTLGTEMGAAFEGLGPDLARLVGDADRMSIALEQNAGDLGELLRRSAGLTTSMAENADRFVDGTAAARGLTEDLAAGRDILSDVVATAPGALTRGTDLVREDEESFGAVLSALATVTPVVSERDESLRAGLVEIPRGLTALESIVHGDRADFVLVGTQGPVCSYDVPRSVVGDLTVDAVHPGAYCPPGPDVAQRGAVQAPRPNDLGLTNYTHPGTVIGPPVVADPILVPAGTELMHFWRALMEGLGNGTR